MAVLREKTSVIVDIIEAECLNGACWCPMGYTLNLEFNQCELKGAGISPEGEVPEPYCGAAKCTCPKGFEYDPTRHTCKLQMTGKFYIGTAV
ncbi:hypothetical protein E2C01_076586 [Portunus trituberculatus]|uniref:Uncharacterized protein n=1 Tax=Portunus trituberculatus TaxID=210409 RepID=A0A5B7II48_PORTR|nr:hypothetical protein [Portunus trituberculatus]